MPAKPFNPFDAINLSNKDNCSQKIHQDFANKKEFVTEFMPTILTESTPEIPLKCGNIGVEWSSLSKTQKKRMKAKAKGREFSKEVKEPLICLGR